MNRQNRVYDGVKQKKTDKVAVRDQEGKPDVKLKGNEVKFTGVVAPDSVDRNAKALLKSERLKVAI